MTALGPAAVMVGWAATGAAGGPLVWLLALVATVLLQARRSLVRFRRLS